MNDETAKNLIAATARYLRAYYNVYGKEGFADMHILAYDATRSTWDMLTDHKARAPCAAQEYGALFYGLMCEAHDCNPSEFERVLTEIEMRINN